MITDAQLRMLRRLDHHGAAKELAAVKSGMDPKTARKYRRLGKLPSEVKIMDRDWLTRPDPFAEVWPERRCGAEPSPVQASLGPSVDVAWQSRLRHPHASGPFAPAASTRPTASGPPLRMAIIASSPWRAARPSILFASTDTLRPAFDPKREMRYSAASLAARDRKSARAWVAIIVQTASARGNGPQT